MLDILSKISPLLEKLGEFFTKALLAFLSYNQGVKDSVAKSNAQELEDVNDAQEIIAAVRDLSDDDLDSGLLKPLPTKTSSTKEK